jgi:small subunit ribosomal protein S7
MARKTISRKRFPEADIKYNSYLVSLLIQKMLKSGKKTLAQKLVYRTLDIIKNKTNEDPLAILEKSVKKANPTLEIKTKRVGGSTYRVPTEISSFRSINLAIRWIITYSNKRLERSICHKLANEIIETSKNSSLTIKRKEEIHKNVEANKAFSHI